MKNPNSIFARPMYYFIFPVIVLALFGTSLVRVPCPVCGGTGSLSQSVDMQDVRVVSVESRILSSQQDACTPHHPLPTHRPRCSLSSLPHSAPGPWSC